MLGAIFPGILAVICGVIAYLHFKEKGPIFNNAYIFATKEERAKMNKKPHYRQSAICFLLLTVNFILDAVAILTNIAVISYVGMAFLVVAVVYAVVSSVVIATKYGIR